MHGQIIITYAGTGTAGYSGDGGPATNAQFQNLVGIAMDTAGNLYVPDYNNNVVRKVDTGGIITTIAGTGAAGYTGDGGPASAAKLDHPWNVFVDAPGNVYIAEQANSTIRKINTSGIITTIAGNGSSGYSGDGGAATAATFNEPWGIAMSDAGDLYISDVNNNRIRKVNPFGTVSSVAGTGSFGYNGDNILATTAELSFPTGIVWLAGKLYIADKLNNRIRVLTGTMITTVAGTGTQGNSGDGGLATAAEIYNPAGLAADSAGNLLFTDLGNHVVRKITGTAISRVAGNGTHGYSGDGSNALAAQLSQPWGVAAGKHNSLFIADKNNYRVRKVYTPPSSGVRDLSAGVVDMYPNPARSTLTITATNAINNIEVYNLSGQLVYAQEHNDKAVTVDVSSLVAGTYIVRVNGAMVQRFTKL